MKKLVTLTIYCIFLHLNSYSQTYDPSKVNKKAVALYEQALQRAEDGNLTLSAGLLLKAIETDNKYLEAYLSLAGVYGQLKNYNTSIGLYEKAFAMDSVYTIDYKLPYSIQLAGIGEFEKALIAINELLEKDRLKTKMP
jgi:tetratricopeptide (TPR) repeat protein